MKKILLACIVASLFVVGCKREICPQGINQLPMYGKAQKCKQQLESDEKFIQVCLKQYGTKEQACIEMMRFGWKYYADGDLEMSMKRFNQAWLLDSLNAEVYTGFGKVLSDEGKYKESVEYFERSLQLKPKSADVLKALGTSFSNIYDQTKDREYLDKAVEQLKGSIAIKNDDASAYALLTTLYAHYEQQDSARKYLEIADKMNHTLVEKEIREHILQR